MNAKYPDAYGVCYKTATERIIGLREGFSTHWFVGYVDNQSKRKGYPFFKVQNSLDPERAQLELDAFAIKKRMDGRTMIENYRQLAKTRVNGDIAISIWQTIEPGKKPFAVELITLKPHVITKGLPFSTPCDDLIHAARNYVRMIDYLAAKDPANVTDWYVFDALANQQILSAIESREIQSLKNRIVREVA